MNTHAFFNESKEQSKVKAEIVAKYLATWAKVVIPSTRKKAGRIAYVDLFAGPGRYEDGTKSTPLLVLERAVADTDMCEMLVTFFSDADPNHTKSLQRAIYTIPNISSLKHKPEIYNEVVDENVTKAFEQMKIVPTLSFLDPWGYKGLSCRLINSVIKDWGCDSIIFFNYNRINMGLCNDLVAPHMNALFEKERADQLRVLIKEMSPDEREVAILNAISDALREMGGEFVLPFRFRGGRRNHISHHLIFVSKSRKGYDIMKEIMAKASTSAQQGVPSFECNPLDCLAPAREQPYLLPPLGPLDALEDDLLKEYAGTAKTFLELFNEHNVGTPYIKPNYRKTLSSLELRKRIVAVPPSEKRPKRLGEPTFGPNVVIRFPAR